MGIYDRDYMRGERHEGGSWWQGRSHRELLGVGMLVLSLLSSAAWYFRGHAWNRAPDKGSLCVNINTASRTELESLPGIGESRAQLIIAHRPYESLDQVAALKGIGPALVQDLRPFMKTTGRNERLPTRR